MKLRVKSNGNVVEMKSEIYNDLPEDQKLSYEVLEKKDAKETTIANEVGSGKTKAPESGDKK